MTPTPFTLHVPEAAITDLQQRLAATRFPDQPPGPAWETGADLAYVQALVEHWRTGFDWRAAEAGLNAFPQFKLPLHGIGLHYLHVLGTGPAPQPLLLSHGWPGSVFEFLELIPHLTDRRVLVGIRPTPLRSWRRPCRDTACRSSQDKSGSTSKISRTALPAS